MHILPTPPCNFNQLKLIKELEDVPDDQLQWLLSNAECRIYEPGEEIFQPDVKVEHLHIMIDGSVQIWHLQSGSKQTLFELEAPCITGNLPFSRLKVAPAHGEIMKKLTCVCLHVDYFPQMIKEKYELTEALVRSMSSRIRQTTSQMLQNDKLLSLGKLSAGLSHELNNPAAAVVRSAQALKKHLAIFPDLFKNTRRVKLADEDIDLVNEIAFSKFIPAEKRAELTLMELSELEDELAGYLEEHGFDEPYDAAETLAEYRFKVSDLKKINAITTEKYFKPLTMWIVKNLVTESMVQEIEEASRRIKELVSSVKSYTHMDESLARKKVDIHASVTNTLTILGYKIKKFGIHVDKQLEPKLPRILGHGGEINQVLTNLLDNAIDAMETTPNKHLIVKTESHGDQICIIITDTGTGIPDDVINKVFDPFFTTKEIGKGTGLGLDIVQKIITRHKGTVTVASSPKGTSFTILLPIV